MTKIAYNNCFGGFSLSYAGVMRYAEIKGIKIYGFVNDRKSGGGIDGAKCVPVDPETASGAFCIHYRTTPDWADKDKFWSDTDIERTDPALIQVIEEMGKAASGSCANLAVEYLPAGTLYRIEEYDGSESVMTQDTYRWKTA